MSGPKARRWLWFLVLWGAGVAAVGVVAMVLRWVLRGV
nr:DUF2474 domain-containing protein [Siccirubricoccus sp. G192]